MIKKKEIRTSDKKRMCVYITPTIWKTWRAVAMLRGKGANEALEELILREIKESGINVLNVQREK